MGIFFLFLFFVLLVCCFPVFLIVFIKKYFDYKQQVDTELVRMRKSMELVNVEEMQRQLTAHQSRIAALEAIVTDKGYELSEKIASL